VEHRGYLILIPLWTRKTPSLFGSVFKVVDKHAGG